MKPGIEELIARIAALQEQVEEEYRKRREEFEARRRALADELLRQQHRHKVGLLRYLGRARLLVALTAPLIYLGWIPFLLLDLFASVYQAVCFPVYGIPKVRRAEYLVFDREALPYLNVIERVNCFYCSYGNGVVAYVAEIAARTEQYWCPIKHARRLKIAHGRYPRFFDYGDAQAYRQGLERLQKDYRD